MESIPHEFEALAVLLVLLPGFLCSRIVQTLCVRPEQSDVDKILESLLYSFLVYLCFVFAFGKTMPITVTEAAAKDAKKTYNIGINRSHLAALAGFSVVLGILIGVDKTRDFSGSIFRRARLSQRTTRSSVWNDIFHERSGAVLVGLNDGRRVMGWAQYYSDDPEEGSLFLEKAAWINDDGSEAQINGAGILLTKESKIEYIEFLDWSDLSTNSSNDQSLSIQPFPNTILSQTPASIK